MTEKERKLLNALNIIKKTCEESDSCSDCPCGFEGTCMVHKSWPNEWNLVKDQPDWKAFNR